MNTCMYALCIVLQHDVTIVWVVSSVIDSESTQLETHRKQNSLL